MNFRLIARKGEGDDLKEVLWIPAFETEEEAREAGIPALLAESPYLGTEPGWRFDVVPRPGLQPPTAPIEVSSKQKGRPRKAK